MSLFFRSESRAMHPWDMEGDAPSPRRVSPESATHLAPVFAAIRHIVDYVSTLPVDFYSYKTDGTRVRATTPDLYREISNEVGWETWVGQLAYGLVTVGNAVGKKTRVNGFGRPSMVEWAGDWSGGEDGPIAVGGKVVSPATLVHVPWIVPPGRKLGLSPIGHYASIVRAGLAAQDYADLKRGGGLPPSWIKNVAQTLDAKDAEAVSARAAAAWASGRPFAHGRDWDFGAVTIPPNHAQFIETLKLSANQIAAIYGIDPREIGGQSGDSLTYTNDESRALNRRANNLPYITRIEYAINRLLADQTHIKFNIDATIRGDIKTRTEVVGAQIADGRMSVNEARALEDRPPVPGGDFYNVPAPKAEPTSREGLQP